MELDVLKNSFESLRKKHSLPSFDELNDSFDIGKIETNSGNFMRDIRRTMMEKIVHYIRLAELMINPSQGSPIFFVLLREITPADRKVVDGVFQSFVSLELASYKLDVGYDEKGEVAFIKTILSTWKETKPSVIALLTVLERNWHSNQKKNEKAYFS